MRVGQHPLKEKQSEVTDGTHSVVMSVHIPPLEHLYFRDALRIFDLSLTSLLASLSENTRISLFSDSSDPAVEEVLYRKKQESSKIDQVFISSKNVGKINAMLSVIRSNRECIMTLTDSDVLFGPNWETEVVSVLTSFPEAGMVSPLPTTGSGSYAFEYSSTTLFFGFMRRYLQLADVQDSEGLIRFNESIGRPALRDSQLSKQMILNRNGVSAVIGAGHFVATYRSTVFSRTPISPALHKIGNGVEGQYLDAPVNDGGYLRLSTRKNHAFHMGNRIEDWMLEEAAKIADKTDSADVIFKEIDSVGRPLSAGEVFAGRLLNKFVMKKKPLRHYFQLMLGLDDRDY